MKITRIFGLILGLQLLFAFSGPAHADTFTCANVPNSFNGDIDITEGGACNIGHPVSATNGHISINAGGPVDVQSLTTQGQLNNGQPITIMTSSGTVMTGTLSSASQAGGNITVSAPGQITTGAINASGSIYQGGNINLTSTGAGVTAASVDASAQTNINGGTITVNAMTDVIVSGQVNASGNFATGGFVTITSQQGQIQTGDILSSSAHSTSGMITLNTTGGTKAIQTGSLTSDHDPNNPLPFGHILVTSGSKVHVVGHISAGGYLKITTPFTPSSGSDQNTIVVDDYAKTKNANLLLLAGNNVSVGNVIIDNATAQACVNNQNAGAVDIEANIGRGETGGTAQFLIGGTGNANGVASVNTDTVNGGCSDQFGHGGIFISNEGKGGIRISDGALLSLKATNSHGGLLFLDAHGGTLLLNGTLSADGIGSKSAGLLALRAKTIEAETAATITASDNGTAQLSHFVWIAAAEIKKGPGLTIHADGSGNVNFTSLNLVGPKEAFTLFTDHNPSPITVSTAFSGTVGFIPGSLTISGPGALLTTADGNNAYALISGYPLVFNGGGAVEVGSDASFNHRAFISYEGVLTPGTTGIQFGNGPVTVHADGKAPGDNGGQAFIISDKVVNTNSVVSLRANGNQTGFGGTVQLLPTTSAVTIGNARGQFSLTAKGGAQSGSGGNAIVSVEGTNVTDAITVRSTTNSRAIDVSVPGSDGTGGGIYLIGSSISFTGTGNELNADGNGSGSGGFIRLQQLGAGATPITLGTGAGSVKLSASSPATGTGNGGTIEVLDAPSIVATGAQIDVLAGAAAGSNGFGGNITLRSTTGDITLNGNLKANAEGTGDAGTISINSGANLVFNGAPNKLTANGNGVTGTENIHLEANGPITVGGAQSQVDLTAKGLTSPEQGGFIKVVSRGSSIAATAASITVKAGDTGSGGSISLEAPGNITLSGTLQADAGNMGTGAAGFVFVGTGDTLLFDNLIVSKITANGNGSVSQPNIALQANGPITVNGALSGVELAAKGIALGQKGGFIGIVSTASGVTIDGASIDTTPGIDGDGGQILVRSEGTINLNGILDASSRQTGNGGRVTLDSADPMFFGSGAKVKAQGRDTGEGGKVIIGNAAALDVNQIITVDGGNNAASSKFDGSIQINTVTCQQWKTDISWPKTYWDCFNPSDERTAALRETSIAPAAATLPSSIKNDLRAADAQIYAMKDDNDFAKFFDGGPLDQNGLLGRTEPEKFAASAYNQTLTPDPLDPYYEGTILHELGHQWDFIRNKPSTGSNFKAAVDMDVAAFNALPCDDAITANGAPASFCATYSGTRTNFQILQTIIKGAPDPLVTDYNEAWARAFAHKAKDALASPSTYTLPFVSNVQEMMAQQKAYMNQVFATGTPF